MFTDEFVNLMAEAVAKQVVSQLVAHGAGNGKRLMTVADATVYLGRTAKALKHMIARGTIQVTKIDGKRQIDQAALDKLIGDYTYYES